VQRGMTAKSASSGQEALDLLDRQPFDLVLLDIRMADMDGLTVLQQIRSRHPETAVIMITGFPTIDTAVECTKLGAHDYLVKPFQLEDLEAVLKTFDYRHAASERSIVDENGLRIDSEKNHSHEKDFRENPEGCSH